MRQIKIIVVSICFLLLMGEPAFAGSLNANEQELVGIITGTYTYKGVTYRVKDRYVQMAIDYLMQDEVDLTDEQKQKAINKMYSSVQQGIDEGYLEAAGGGGSSGTGGGGGAPGASGGNADGKGGTGESGTGSSGPGGGSGQPGDGVAGKSGDGAAGQPGDGFGLPGMSPEAVTVPETTVSPMVLSLEAVAAENRGLSRPAGLSGGDLDSSGGTSGADRSHLGADGSYLGASGIHPETAEGHSSETEDNGISGGDSLSDVENELSGQVPRTTAAIQPGTSGLLTLAFGTCSGLAIGTVLCILAAIRGKLFSHHDKRKKGMV